MNNSHQNGPGSNAEITWQIVPLEPCDQPLAEDLALKRVLLAVNERVKRHGQSAEQTHFVEVTLWGGLADTNAQLAKGAGVLAIGSLLNDSWTDREGHKRHALKLEAAHLETMVKKVVPPLGAFNLNRFSSPSSDVVAFAARRSSRSGPQRCRARATIVDGYDPKHMLQTRARSGWIARGLGFVREGHD